MPADTIFIVDPDPDTCASVEALLSRLGYVSKVFHSGMDFMAYLASTDHVPQGCIISEMTLPDLTGLQLMAELNEADVALPVIILTNDSDVKTAVRALHTHASGYLKKPYVERDLMNGVRQALAANR